MNGLPYIEVPAKGEHKASLIWLHGLGDSGHGFAPVMPYMELSSELGVNAIFPHAPQRPMSLNNGGLMPSWYEIPSMDLDNRAYLPDVQASMGQIHQLIEAEMAKGIPAHKIILAGFSQGGVMALYAGLRFPHRLGGIIGASCYMAGGDWREESHANNAQQDIFLAHGEQDETVPFYAGELAHKQLAELEHKVQWQAYPMQHNVCLEELKDIGRFITKCLEV